MLNSSFNVATHQLYTFTHHNITSVYLSWGVPFSLWKQLYDAFPGSGWSFIKSEKITLVIVCANHFFFNVSCESPNCMSVQHSFWLLLLMILSFRQYTFLVQHWRKKQTINSVVFISFFFWESVVLAWSESGGSFSQIDLFEYGFDQTDAHAVSILLTTSSIHFKQHA